jgi:putative spermidine/putrescine transport system permease protein
MESTSVRWFFRVISWAVLAFLYVPLVIVVLYAFTKQEIATWPPELFSTSWFSTAFHNPTVRSAIVTSIVVGLAAMAISLVLGSLAAFAMGRTRFFGRDAISFALVLPIAFPGIVTALALSSMVDAMPGLNFGVPAIIVGHATFCVVVVFNNVVARVRRTSGSIVEASMDLGADGLTTFRYVTLPSIRTALIAGGLLAFGLSFDEIVVTLYLSGTTQTLPIWIYNNVTRPFDQPEVFAVAAVMLLISIVPVYAAIKLSGEGALRPSARGTLPATEPAP